jgi:hypothetical protein
MQKSRNKFKLKMTMLWFLLTPRIGHKKPKSQRWMRKPLLLPLKNITRSKKE